MYIYLDVPKSRGAKKARGRGSFWVGESRKKVEENVNAACQRGQVLVISIATAECQLGLNFTFMLPLKKKKKQVLVVFLGVLCYCYRQIFEEFLALEKLKPKCRNRCC